MQIPSVKLTLQKAVKTGIVGKETTTYVTAKDIIGSLAPLSREDFIKRYSETNFKDNGSYSFQTEEVLAIGNILNFEGKSLKVIGFRKGRIRNTAYLVEGV
ncbi:hypothetical protein [Deinococcus ficus]|uniref:hypothetical protein n=1 Tax=Deinococcus ficus TaxID=317577 RepID=UPI00131D15CE|nr:hypothetical protein [Deinococcus ficus]